MLATPITIEAAMPSRERTTAHAVPHPAMITKVSATSTNHNGESCRDSTKMLAATAVDHTSLRRCREVTGSDARSSTATHSSSADAISSALGFTTELMNNTVGVSVMKNAAVKNGFGRTSRINPTGKANKGA